MRLKESYFDGRKESSFVNCEMRSQVKMKKSVSYFKTVPFARIPPSPILNNKFIYHK